MQMYSVLTSNEVTVDANEAADLVALVLQDDYESLSEDINGLRGKGRLQSYEAADLANFLEMREAMGKLLRYYMTTDAYSEFMELQRVYGND